MLLASWRSLLGHKIRLLLSTLAITLAVAFVSGSLVFTNLLNQAFTNLLKGTLADVNVAVAGTYDQSVTNTTALNTDATLEPINLTAISAVAGVSEVVGVLTAFDIYPTDSAGRTIGTPGAPSISSNWFTAPAAEGGRGVVLRSGRAPETDAEVVVDPDTLETSGYALGDTMTLRSPAGDLQKTIVGTANWGDAGGTAGATYLFMTTHEMQRLATGGKDVYLVGWVVADQGEDTAELAERISRVLPSEFEAVSGDEAAQSQADSVSDSLGFLTTFLLVFAGIAVLVASFLIVNTFNILVTQRSRELALLRAVGAKRRQVLGSVLLEALVIGFISATIGLVLGLGLAWGIKAIFGNVGFDLGTIAPTLTWDAVLASYAVGIVVTVVAAIVPAVRASRVPPVVAMTGDNVVVDRGFDPVGWVGLGLAVVGFGLLGFGGWGSYSIKWWLVGAGAVLALIGMAVGTPVIGRPIVLILGKVYQRTHGEVGVMAQRNALRNPRRLASTASALMIGLTLVTTVSVLGASASATISKSVVDQVRGDLQITSLTGTPFEKQIVTDAEAVAGVSAVYPLLIGSQLTVGDQTVTATAMSEDAVNQIYTQTMVEGRFPTGAAEVMVGSTTAESAGWSVGQTLTVEGVGIEPTTLSVVGIFDRERGEARSGGFVVNSDFLATISPQQMVSRAAVYLEDGADAASIEADLQQIADTVTDLRVTNTQELVQLRIGQISGLLNLVYGLLGLALVIAVLGIVNTLALAIMERTREIGLMRAIGLTRKQLRQLITLEAVSIAVLGSLMGTLLGLICGVTVRQAASDDGLSTLSIPWVQLTFYVLLAAVVGVIAAVWPARRAAKLDVLAAIATD